MPLVLKKVGKKWAAVEKGTKKVKYSDYLKSKVLAYIQAVNIAVFSPSKAKKKKKK